MKAIGTVQQSPFDLALLSVISDGQTGGWGPCAPRSTAQHSNRLYSLLRYHPLRSLSYRETSRERERKASSSSLGYKPATNSTGYSGMFSNLSEILLFLVDQNHTRLAIDLWRGPPATQIFDSIQCTHFFPPSKATKTKRLSCVTWYDDEHVLYVGLCMRSVDIKCVYCIDTFCI